MGTVTYEQDGAVGIITLSQPPQNRLNARMIEELASAVESAEADGARALMVRGAGEHFSFGVEPSRMGWIVDIRHAQLPAEAQPGLSTGRRPRDSHCRRCPRRMHGRRVRAGPSL